MEVEEQEPPETSGDPAELDGVEREPLSAESPESPSPESPSSEERDDFAPVSFVDPAAAHSPILWTGLRYLQAA
jgi:hypothetical protein